MSRNVSESPQLKRFWPFRTGFWQKSFPLVLGALACFGGSQAIAQTGRAQYGAPNYQPAPVRYDQWGRPICPPCPPGWRPTPSPRRLYPSPPSQQPSTPQTPSPMQPSPPDSPMDAPPTPESPMNNANNQSAPSPAQDFANNNTNNNMAASNLNFGSAQGGLGSTDVAFSNAPSMIGDFFGSGSSTLIFTPPPVPTNVPAFSFQPQSVSNTQTVSGQFRLANDPSIQANFVSSNAGMGNLILSQGAAQPVSFGGVTVANPGSFSSQSPFSSPPSNFILVENGNVTGAVQAAFPGATVTHVGSAANQDPANPGNIYFVTSTYDATTTTTVLVPVQIPGGQVILVPQRPIAVSIPSPSSSGFVVGRQKIAENSSPIPRDRVFTNYSYFDNAALTGSGVNVNRITPGFEKTFWDGNASIEMRFPFASTLSTDIVAGGQTNTDDTQFGNINMALKLLTYQSQTFAWSNGLGVTVPTGDDLSVGLANGFPLLEVKNDAVHLLPFTGFLWVPDNRWFVQGYLQADFDANGNQVYVSDGTGRLINGGVANDQTFLYADLGMGYWLYQDPTNHGLSGLAPIAEVHYNRSVQSSDVIQAGNVSVGTGGNDIQVLDAVVGATAKLGDRAFLTAAYATPVGNTSDKQFDGEARVTFNWFFGGSVSSPFSYGSVLP